MQPVRTYAGFTSVIFCFAALTLAQAAYSDEATDLAAAKVKAEKDKQEAFDKSKCGIGISATIDTGRDRITNAEMSNNIVRVSGDNNFVARLLLERHFFNKKYGECHMGDACGMFVAVQLGSTNSQFLDAIGAGYMWGWKPTSFSDSVSSFNLGIGLIADPNTKVLGDGITKNQPLQAGDTLRFRTTTKYGALVLVSFGM